MRAILLSLLVASMANAQNYRGEAIPVVQRVDPVELSRARFLTFAFGHEGPMDTPLTTAPVAGREYFFEADVFGIESVGTIRFELLDTTGRSLQILNVWKETDATDSGEFHGFLKVPSEPFRFAISGTGTTGTAFRSVLRTVFQTSSTSGAEPPILPPGLSAAERNQLQQLVEAYRRELQARAVQAAADHPNGVLTLSRATVSRITYEPFNTKTGLPIGVRLHYSIRFPVSQTLVAMPHVFPVYQAYEWRGVVAMKVSGGTISPSPQMVGAQTMQDVIVYSGAATYQAGAYNFTVDLLPDYVIQGTQTGRFCLYEQKFNNRAVWDALVASATDVPYSVSISDTDTAATIPIFFSQRTFHRNLTTEGAFDCGPTPTTRF